YGKAVADNLPDLGGEEKPRGGQFAVLCQDDAFPRVVVAHVPEGVEGCGEVVEVERDAVRLARLGGGFHLARELRGDFHQLQLVGTERMKRLIGGLNTLFESLAQRRPDPRARVLDAEED